MEYQYIGNSNPDYNDKNILAVLNRGDVVVTFIEVSDDLLESEYDCLSWYDHTMLIGISKSYIAEIIEPVIVEKIDEVLVDYEENPSIAFFEEMTIKYLSQELHEVLSMVVETSDPYESSVDAALSKILKPQD